MIYLKNTLVVLGFFMLVTTVKAQIPQRGNGQAPTGRFYGKVVDAANKGIDAASVTLVTTKPDSVTKQPQEIIVGGMLTSASGNFSIENIPVMGKYTLRVSGIGFHSRELPVSFEMPRRNGNDPMAMMGAFDRDLGNIRLEVDAQVLGNVTVTATRPQLQMGIDRKVFNVDRNIVSAGGTAVDVMRNVPSVNVDIDGNITLRNNTPQIFVDGRPTNLTLDQIPADVIESIEIITNPSAKFDASGGTAGILNIVLKKNRRVGYSGNVRVNGDSRGRVGGGGDINIRQGKVNFFMNGMLNQRKTISTGLTERINFENGYSTSFIQHDRTVGTGRFGFLRGGVDFLMDNRNTITVNGSISRGKMMPTGESEIFIDSVNGNSSFPVMYQNRNTDSEFEFRNAGGQVSYKHNFPKTAHELTADITYYRSRNSSDNLLVTDFYDMPGKTFLNSYRQVQQGSGRNEFFVFQTDYSNPVNDRSKFETGLRASVRNVNSQNQFFVNTGNGTLVSTAPNIIYESTDRVFAAYGTFSSRIKNFGYQLGLRAESSDYTASVPTRNQAFSIEFPVSLFPSVFLSQKISDMQELQLNYSRRINRPNFWQLTPFVDSSDLLNINVGNPGLEPEFTNSIEMSFSQTMKNRDNILLSVYFRNTNNLITRFQHTDTVISREGVVNSYINADRSYVTGLEITSRNRMTGWWDITSNANFFTARIDVPGQEAQDQFPSYFLKINNSFRIPKRNLTFQLSGDYQSRIVASPGGGGRGHGMFGSPNTAAQGFIRPNFGVDAAVRYEFLKEKRASVSLNINDIFRTRLYDAHTEALPYFVQDIQRRRDPQIVRLNFNWRFGKFDAALFKRKNTRADNNMNVDAPSF